MTKRVQWSGHGAYTCVGSVRGACGVLHATAEEAERHIFADANACAKQGGYSDRVIVDGEHYTYSQRCAIGDEDMARMKLAWATAHGIEVAS